MSTTMNTDTNPHALVVEDDQQIIDDVQYRLESLGHTYDCAETQEETRNYLKTSKYSYVLLDLALPVQCGKPARVQTGLNLLDEIAESPGGRDAPIIVMTGNGLDGPDLAIQVLRSGRAVDFIKKPFIGNGESLEKRILSALEKARERSRNAEAQSREGAQIPDPQSSGDGATGPAKPRLRKRCPEELDQPAVHTIHFGGESGNRRFLVVVHGRQVWLPPRAFSLLWRLWIALRDDPPGMVHKGKIDPNFHKVLSGIRNSLRALKIATDLVQGDGHGKFRLAVSPANVSINERMMRGNHPGFFRE